MVPVQSWTSERAGRSEVLSKRMRSSCLRPRGRARIRCVHAPCSVRAMTSCVTACTHSLEGETHDCCPPFARFPIQPPFGAARWARSSGLVEVATSATLTRRPLIERMLNDQT
ncbi:hypothetical protein MHYP_G00135570 [Metynnis hypsauchen]